MHIFQIFVIFVFTLSSVFHAVQISHGHQGETHEHTGIGMIVVLGEYMHGADKKVFIAACALMLAPLVLIVMLQLLYTWQVPYGIRRHQYLYQRKFDFHLVLLKSGILNPKTF